MVPTTYNKSFNNYNLKPCDHIIRYVFKKCVSLCQMKKSIVFTDNLKVRCQLSRNNTESIILLSTLKRTAMLLRNENVKNLTIFQISIHIT